VKAAGPLLACAITWPGESNGASRFENQYEAEIISQLLQRKSLDSPDEVRPFKDGKGRAEIVTVGEAILGRGSFEPGWVWSQHVKPIAGTPSCQARGTPVTS
jgi:hypothetical protein